VLFPVICLWQTAARGGMNPDAESNIVVFVNVLAIRFIRLL